MSTKTGSPIRQIESWHPDNGRWLATLSPEPKEIANRTGLHFRRETDDLGRFLVAFVELASGCEFMLRGEQHPSVPGTMIWGRTYATVTKSLLHKLLAALHVTADEVAEISPDL